jgi:beta-mannosidase
MERDYAVPKNFEDYVFLSQVQAGEIMRYTVEHFRRDSDYCRGMILWQLNDCWPVVSWSGIDYYGRWKALQYYIKRFYTPVLATAEDADNAVSLWLSNETPEDCSGTFSWRLMHKNGAVLDTGEATAEVSAGKSKCCVKLDYSNKLTNENRSQVYLHWSFCDGEKTQSGTVLFVLAKEFAFEKPRITYQLEQTDHGYAIEVTSDRFAKCVGFTTAEGDCLFSDNYFDLLPNQKRIITVEAEDCNGITDVQMLERSLKVNTMNDVLLRAKEV